MKHPDLFQIWIAADQFINTLLGGFADETISSRAYRSYKNGGVKWPYYLINSLFWWQNNHCRGAYAAELERQQQPPELRKGVNK